MFNGPDYNEKYDYTRLKTQHERVKTAMLDGEWRTLDEVSKLTGDPHASVSAQLRHLRKSRFGGFIVKKKRAGDKRSGLFMYQVMCPEETEKIK